MTDPLLIIDEVKSKILYEIREIKLIEGAKGNKKKNFVDSLCNLSLRIPNEIFNNNSIVRKSLWN